MTLLDQYIEHLQDKERLSAELDDAKAALADVESQLLSQFEQDGVQSVKHKASGRTVFTRRDLRSGLGDDKDAAIFALEEFEDAKFLVKPNVNAQQLSAWVRELPRDNEDMPIVPDAIKEAIKVHEIFKISARKS